MTLICSHDLIKDFSDDVKYHDVFVTVNKKVNNKTFINKICNVIDIKLTQKNYSNKIFKLKTLR